MLNIVKNTTFITLLDLLAPYSCRGCNAIGKPLCDCCKKNILLNHKNYCPNCKSENPSGNCQHCPSLPQTYIIDERQSLIGDLIYDYKFSSSRAISKTLADLLDQTLPDFKTNVLVVPLPTNTKHVRERGFDHTLLLAKNFAKLRGKKYSVQKLLTRVKNTTQVGASAEIRSSQAEKAYKVNSKIKINPNATYLILDDIWTTGSSMQSALKKLQGAGASKIVLALLAINKLN